jgi:eukaryotic-like serine/threonine-protein kinase
VAPATPPALASLVERGLDPEPRRRPSAAELAVQVYAAAEALPVRLVPLDPAADAAEVVTHRLRQAAAATAAEPAPPSATRSRRLPLLVTLGAVVAAVVAAGASGLLPDGGGATTAAVPPVQERTAPSASRPSTMTPSVTMTPTFTPAVDDLAAVVAGLSDLRARGFATVDEAPLREANVEGSGALAADLATLADLDAQQVRLDGLAFGVSDVEVVSRGGADAVVTLTVVTGAHRVLADDGTVVEEVAASEPARVQLVLAQVGGRWRVSEVR